MRNLYRNNDLHFPHPRLFRKNDERKLSFYNIIRNKTLNKNI